MSLNSIVSTIALSGLFALTACDKGPKTGEPTPETKSAEVTSAAKAQEATAAAAQLDGKSYGAAITESETVSIAEINADPEAFDGKTVRVEGMVTDVCVMRGCWFEMAGEKPGEKIRFKVDDGEMVFPVSAKGQKAVAQGKIVTQKLSLEEARAQAEYSAKEAGKEFDPDSITEGTISFRIEGTGAVIGDSE